MMSILIYLIVEKYLCSTSNKSVLGIDNISEKNRCIELLIEKFKCEIKNSFQISENDSLSKIAYTFTNFISMKILKEQRFQKIAHTIKILHLKNKSFVEKSDDFFIPNYNTDDIKITKTVVMKYNKALIFFVCISLRKSYFESIKNIYNNFLESIKENAHLYSDLIFQNIPNVEHIIEAIDKMESIYKSSLGTICSTMSSILNGKIEKQQIQELNDIILKLDGEKQIYLKNKQIFSNLWRVFNEKNRSNFF
ncbi:hypothetical protein CWI37_0575p0020 [Hamiltosporidium tvaerminnensis]|uniref:Uncharacterized protein n=1 Tax=Hamiltosporidium tvaerminnensis TaxID=1176355 RepID=A0A4Q9L3E5_9MICR|nr:hypothetical protein CWI37_0575p0020 [Hamiltosporidium tvaerminnensis]